MFWVVRVLGDMWSSWGPDIGTALAATNEIDAEGSAAGTESGVTSTAVGVQQLGEQR